MKPTNIDIDQFDFHLPEEQIAIKPLEKRDQSKLLVFNDEISDSYFNHLPSILNSNQTLVFNNTKVINARFEFFKDTGARIEIFLLEPLSFSSMEQALASKEKQSWKCLVGNAKRWKNGALTAVKEEVDLNVISVESGQGHATVQFDWSNSDMSFSEVIESFGNIPLPPYIKRKVQEADQDRYQCVYADNEGSVAAPTAGLHFNDSILQGLSDRGVGMSYVCLHVGAGTFMPVSDQNVVNHVMHSEKFSISKENLESWANSSGEIIPVGTTSMRSLESLYWLACESFNSKKSFKKEEYHLIDQWLPYVTKDPFSNPRDAFSWISEEMSKNKIETLNAATQLMIIPTYESRIIDALITNFHLPKSTLLLLVASIVGEEWKEIYKHALNNGYRFLSYGDGSLLHKKR